MGKQPMRHYRARRPEPKPVPQQPKASLSVRAVRYLAGFLILMVLFTLLSRAADSLTIPKVALAYPSKGTIDRKMTGFGKVEELSAQAVVTEPGLRVAGVAVKPGSVVEEGAPLFTLDGADIEEKLDAAREALRLQDMDLADRASRDSLTVQEREKAIERANEDYAAAKASGDREVERAAKALEEAKAKRAAAAAPKGELSALETACTQAGEALRLKEDELSRLQNEVEERSAQARRDAEAAGEDPDQWESAVREEYRPMLEQAAQEAETAQQKKTAADAALAAYTEAAAQIKLLDDEVEAARQSYERAVETRDNALRSAGRQVEDAGRPQAQDSSGERALMDRERQARQVERLEALLESGGVVRAPCSGTVTGVSVTVGVPTPDGTALLLAGEANGGIFTAQFSGELEKYLSPGDEAVIRLGSSQMPIEGLKLETVSVSAVDPSMLDVTVRPPEGALAVGTAAELEVRRKSREYPCLVPLSALHEDNGAYFLLVTREKMSVLGTELTAARLDVTVLEKNETMAAIDAGALNSGQGFLAASGKAVNVGDRVRLEAP